MQKLRDGRFKEGVADDICDQGKISQDEGRGKVITLMIKKPYQRASEVGDWKKWVKVETDILRQLKGIDEYLYSIDNTIIVFSR